uniref:Uncharacterized protein n=1 Tax=Mycena chlorophos TaxID=658473 RepID=A0ABQ0M1G1_MYCCL|nr:predicted protein [Mycena chlorophos]
MLEYLGLVRRTPECSTPTSTASKKDQRKQKKDAAKAAKAAAAAQAAAAAAQASSGEQGAGGDAESGAAAASGDAEAGSPAQAPAPAAGDPAASAQKPATPPTSGTSTNTKGNGGKGSGNPSRPKAPAVPAAAPAPAPSAPPQQPVGTVTNKPTKAVTCTNANGGQSFIGPANLQNAIERAQKTPLFPKSNGNTKGFFPHVFKNRIPDPTTGRLVPEVKFAPPQCQTEQLVEHAVGSNMDRFSNTIKNQFPFRVVITKPDAKGDTTFCGVITHGKSVVVPVGQEPPTARFLPNPCPNA